MCQNTTMGVYGARIKMYYVICPKTYSTSFGNCYNPQLVRDKPLGVPAFVKLVYFYGQISYILIFVDIL